MNKLDAGHLYSEPFDVRVEGAAVVILGPDAVSIAFTPEAALKSAELLAKAGRQAQRSDDTATPVLPIDQE